MSAHAQLSGSVGLSGETTSNVQSLDTTSPDKLLIPAFTLSYDVPVSGASKLTFGASMAPSYYSVNPALSYNATTLGATGQFYLSNLDAIATATDDSKLLQWEQKLPSRTQFFSHIPIRSPQRTQKHAVETNDSLIDVASSALYTLSGQLDSSDIQPSGLTKKQLTAFEDLRDSISDAVITIADILDSVGYSESSADILLKELKGLRAPLTELAGHLKGTKTNPRLLELAIIALSSVKPQSDFLPAASAPLGAQASLSSVTKTDGTHAPAVANDESEHAPIVTLVGATSRLREFGYNDISVHEDLDDLHTTTLATKLTVPISWSSHKAISFSKADLALFGGDTSLKGNPNNNTTFNLGAAISAFPSSGFGLRASYDLASAHYPFDSVYSNSEHRFALNGRFGLSSTVLFAEAALGFRKYTSPLQVTRQVQYDSIGKFGKTFPRVKDSTVASDNSFHQFSYGLGVAQFLGERFVIGALATFNNNPNLRAYVTNATVVSGPLGKKKIRAAVQIADDEYTYDLSRYSVFVATRILWDMDLAGDVSFEDRTYGSAVGPNGNPIPGGKGRTETGVYTNISLSKLLPFEERVLSVFDAVILEGRISLANVSSSDMTYSYDATAFTLGATLTF